MTDTELLLLIALLTGVTAIIQCIEMYFLITSSRRTNELIEDPTPLIFTLTERLSEDKRVAQALGSLFVFAGQCAFSEMKDLVQGKIPKLKPPKNIKEAMAQAAGALFSAPNVQAVFEQKATEIVGGAAKEGGKKVVEGWGL